MEQRVKTLEQEMKILKNQVQKSLLDIQEYLLGQKYATLRPEEVEETAVSSPRLMANEDTVPRVRQVSLADLRAHPVTPLPMPPTSVAPPLPLSLAPAHEDTFLPLVEWVAESIRKIGPDRTRQLLTIRAKTGSLSAEMQNTLEQLIALYATNETTADMTETAVLLQQLDRLVQAPD